MKQYRYIYIVYILDKERKLKRNKIYGRYVEAQRYREYHQDIGIKMIYVPMDLGTYRKTKIHSDIYVKLQRYDDIEGQKTEYIGYNDN